MQIRSDLVIAISSALAAEKIAIRWWGMPSKDRDRPGDLMDGDRHEENWTAWFPEEI
jgi:hypothetical protein